MATPGRISGAEDSGEFLGGPYRNRTCDLGIKSHKFMVL
jgi:hypothetical protein